MIFHVYKGCNQPREVAIIDLAFLEPGTGRLGHLFFEYTPDISLPGGKNTSLVEQVYQMRSRHLVICIYKIYTYYTLKDVFQISRYITICIEYDLHLRFF